MSLLLLFHPKADTEANQDINGPGKKSKRWPQPRNDDDEVMAIIAAALPILSGDQDA